VSIVLPAGTVPKGAGRLETAKRELLEETGYSSGNWTLLSDPNSHTNYQGCKVSFYLALDAVKTAEPHSGDLEEMEILLLSEAEILEALGKNEIKSMGAITGLALAKVRLQKDI
jgi:ADP-ribose pyrophosphatase